MNDWDIIDNYEHSLPSTDIFLALCADGLRGGSLYDWDIRDARRNSPSPTLNMAFQMVCISCDALYTKFHSHSLTSCH